MSTVASAVGSIEYLDEYRASDGCDWHDYDARRRCIRRYGFAVPTVEAIAEIAQRSPVVEIGAGAGYWAHLLQRAGCIVHPYDVAPVTKRPGENHWRFEREWTDVAVGTPATLLGRPYCDGAWALMLCWPYMDNMALECLITFRGKAVIYIGEGEGGCTATSSFFGYLYRHYKEVKMLRLPQWSGIHDYLWVYERNNREGRHA